MRVNLFFYGFWATGIAFIFYGQIYAGYGYRILAREIQRYTQAVYDTRMGWDAHQQLLEQQAQDFSKLPSVKKK